MERKEVIVSEQELARQKEFTRRMREMNDRRTRTPLALVDTFGCQQNVADGEVLMGMLREMGYELTRDENQADVILLNTCAIREHAEKRVYGHLGRLSHTKAAKPDQIICPLRLHGAAEGRGRQGKKIPTITSTLCLAPRPNGGFRSCCTRCTRRISAFSPSRTSMAASPRTFPSCARAACARGSASCTGAITSARTASCPTFAAASAAASRRRSSRNAAASSPRATKEITLLGQNVNSYGKDLGTDYDFADLLAAINAIPGDYWLRFMSSQPKDATNKLFRHDGTLRARCKAAPPPRPVRVRPRSESDEPPLYARKVRGNDRLRAKRHARHGAHERRHHRLPGRDRGRSDADGRSCRKRRSSTRSSPLFSPRVPARRRRRWTTRLARGKAGLV